MELNTLLVVLLVIATLVGLFYFGYIHKPEDIPPPVDEILPIVTPGEAEKAQRRPRMSREERAALREERAKRRARRAARAAATGGATTGTGVADEAAAAVENVAQEILDVETAAKDAEKPKQASLPAFESDARPSAEAIAAAPSADATPVETSDDLTRIKGLGPRAAAQLHSLGVTRFAEIAGWSAEDAAHVDARMGSFQGRIARDRWIEQAGYLARGDLAGFEAKFGSLG